MGGRGAQNGGLVEGEPRVLGAPALSTKKGNDRVFEIKRTEATGLLLSRHQPRAELLLLLLPRRSPPGSSSSSSPCDPSVDVPVRSGLGV